MEANLTQINNWSQVQQTIKRMAFEIAEDNYDEKCLILAGIGKETEGYALAEHIFQELKKILQTEVILTHIEVDKSKPADSPVQLGLDWENLSDQVIILIDDVSNSGRTLLYAMKPLLDHHPKKIQMAVLVERTHKQFPVHLDYVGLSLSTTAREHITVLIKDLPRAGIYLS